MNRPFLAWPGWAFLRFAWLLSGVETLWFVFVYGGCNWVTAHRVWRVRLDLPGELLIPFIPGMTVFYLSIYLLFLAGPFVIRERREFASLIVALILTTLCGGIGFLLLPAQPAYAPPGSLGIWAAPFHFADWVNLDYNMAPSLHVALSVCCVAAFSRHATRRVQRMLWGWAGAIGLSTLLVHQHYVVDVVSGWGLGLAAHRLCQRSDGLVVSAIGRRLRSHRKLTGTILGFAVAIGGSVWVAGWLRVPHTLNQPLPQAVYLWQRQWTDPVRAAATRATAPESTFNELLVFGAEIVAADRSGREVSVAPVTGLDWSLLAKAQRPVGMVVRVRGAQGTAEPRGKVFEALRETVETLCIDAKRAGIKLEEVQVDFDCPTSRLREFAELLAALRHALPDERWTFTALPSWLHSSAFATLPVRRMATCSRCIRSRPPVPTVAHPRRCAIPTRRSKSWKERHGWGGLSVSPCRLTVTGWCSTRTAFCSPPRRKALRSNGRSLPQEEVSGGWKRTPKRSPPSSPPGKRNARRPCKGWSGTGCPCRVQTG